MIKQAGRISVIVLAPIWCLTIASGSFLSVNAQQPSSNRLPILLIHGYNEYPSIWDSWKTWLQTDGFSNVYAISFQDDKCGSVADHAMELTGIVNKVLHDTGSSVTLSVYHLLVMHT
jgi:triacylglycerol esterase/lipase EstA (alpha/beta hydrolase family)